MAFMVDFGGDDYHSSSIHSSNNNNFIPTQFITDFIVKLLNLENSNYVGFERSTKTGTFKVKSDIDILKVVIKKLQLALWENGHFETKVSCKENKIISEYLDCKCQAKAKIKYKKVEIEILKTKKLSILRNVKHIMLEHDIDASELNIDIRESVKIL